MKICAHCHRMDRTGAPIVLHRLLRELVKRHEVHLLLPKIENRPLQASYEAAGIRCFDVVGASRYDVFLCNTIMSTELLMQIKDRVPTVLWIHEPRGGLKLIKQGKTDMRALAAAERVVFPTRWQAEAVFGQWLTRDNWEVVPYGIGIDPTLQPAPFVKQPGRFYLLHVGMITGRKGHDVTVKAIELLQDPTIEVFFLGSADIDVEFVRELNAYLDAHADLKSRLHFMGTVDEAKVNAYLQHCDAVLFPTRDDLITMAILEGLFFEQCVLSSDFGPIPETIRHLDTGLLSPVGDPDVLAQNIQLVRHDAGLRARLGQAGRRAYDRRHSFAAHVAGMERVLSSVARVPIAA